MLKYIITILFFTSISTRSISQNLSRSYAHKNSFDLALQKIINDAHLDSTFNVGEDGTEEISFAVIDLTGRKPLLGGVHQKNFHLSCLSL